MSIRKLTISLFLICVVILNSSKVLANADAMIVNDPSDANYDVAPGRAAQEATYAIAYCGYAHPKNQVESNKCCSRVNAVIDPNTVLADVKNWPCFTLLYIKTFCLKDYIPPVIQIFKSINILPNVDEIDYPKCKTGKPSGDGDACTCVGETDKNMCDRYLAGSKDAKDCSTCMSGDSAYYSALACIKLDSFSGLVAGGILTPLLSLGGMAAFLIIIYSAILIMTSSGDPEKIKKAKEMLTSALVGLLFIILSIFILKFISGDLLGISLKGGK